jgi:hypothetical protein
MTDLLDAPDVRAEEPVAAEAPGAPEPVMDAGEPSPGTRWLLAACLAGAAVVHAAMVPSHTGESALEGWGFVLSAWAQLALAVAVLARPVRRVAVAIVVTNAVLIVVWAVSRTAGLPFGAHAGHAESVTFVDGVCVALEGVAVVVGAALVGWRPLRRLARLRRPVGAAGAAGAVLLATAAVVSPSASDHAAHSHGTTGDEHVEHAGDVGGHDHDAMVAGDAADDLGFSALSNGHQHEHGQDEPLTAAERSTLATQLAATADLVARYPTLADAEAAGWRRSGPFSPGLGTHYQGPNLVFNADGDMDPEDLAAPLLIFDGVTPDAPLAGFMYLAYGSQSEPPGFAGPNDHWHFHEKVCIVSRPGGGFDTPFGADLEGVTADMCTQAGGMFIPFTGYMVHVWNVPGYESPDGMFTELNPKITCPDGTYHTIPVEDLGTKDSTCANP